METTVVGIASVDSKPINTKRGPSTVYIITDAAGLEYTTFDRDIYAAAGARKGRNVLLSFNTKPNTKPNRDGVLVTYTNRYLESVEDSAEDIGPIAAEGYGKAASAVHEVLPQAEKVLRAVFDKDQQIARAVALKAAVELANGAVAVDNYAGVLELAKAFEPYLLGYDAPTETSVANDVEDIPF